MIRKTIYIAFSLCLFSCSQNNPVPSSPTTPTTPTGYDIANWDFETNIYGVTSKAAGVFKYPYQNTDNIAYSVTPGQILLQLSDKSDSSYISGENSYIRLTNTNLSLGINRFDITVITLGDSTWPSAGVSDVFGFQPYSGLNSININITSLGTPTTSAPYVFGSNIEGNSSGTLYQRDLTSQQIINGVLHYDYNIPLGTYSIDFSACRLY